MDRLLLEPWQRAIPIATVPLPQPAAADPPAQTIEQAVTSSTAIGYATERLITARELRKVATDIREGRMTTTPKLNGLQEAFSVFNARVEACAQRLTERMDSVATVTESAVIKFGAAVDSVEAQAKAIDDAANQMTNGGPPLGNS